MLVDLDPLVITASVTESNIGYLQKGQTATGKMVSGDTLKGNIRFISSLSEQGTNTFAVEVAVANPDLQFMAGMSTELSLPLEQTYAVRITPSVMALDEQGNLGVKIVEQIKNEYVVKFVPIDIVKSDSQGVWLAGLGEQADIITLGHGFVRDGDKVAIVRSDSSSTRGEMRSGAHVADSN
jgi:multidrug efflux system membrane fusion protein